MSDVAVLETARDASREQDWARAYDCFAAARELAPLAPDDLDALSGACWWLGRVDECLEAAEAAFRGYLDAERAGDAAMCAITNAVSLFLRGDEALGSGWLGRAQRLLEDLSEQPAHGYLRYIVEVEGALGGADLDAVAAAARDVQQIGRRHHDGNLVAAGVVGEGRALLKRGAAERGLQLLDEAMIAVVSDDLDPEWAGNVYCHLMAACHEVADVARARDWTEATSRWLAQLPAAVLFTGICRVHRSQVLQVTGEWHRAEEEARRVVDDLDGIHVDSVAEAHYQIGEMRRLRGDFSGAEAAYGSARQLGRDPHPGLALTRLAQGNAEAAGNAIAAALEAVGGDRTARARLSPAQAEIALATHDLAVAERACADLEDAAARYGTSGLEAAALHWRGALMLAQGRASEALPSLRAACRRWHSVHATYDAARSCVLLGRAYQEVGDPEAAAAELASAKETFERLGATFNAGEVAELTAGRTLPKGLTERQAEVLALVARGRTNREVAQGLVLSEKTIARHLSNVFTKLGVSTRTEAAAFAFQHGLVVSGPRQSGHG